MPTCVIDTSAVFADLGEEGAIEARRWLRDAAISALNLQEIVAKAVDEGVPEDTVPDLLERLRLVVHPLDALDADLALEAGLLRSVTRPKGLSHGDRACLALVRRLRLPAVTADRARAEVAGAVGVEVVLV